MFNIYGFTFFFIIGASIVLASLVYLVYKKHEDTGFLLSIFVSAFILIVLNQFISIFIFYFYGS